MIDTLGINRASLYDTFGSKKELFDLALSHYQDQNARIIAGFLYYQTNVRQGIYLLFDRMIDDALNNDIPRGCFTTNTTTELASADEKSKKLIAEDKSVIEEIFSNYLQYGINQSQISPYKDLKVISSYLYALQSGIKVISKVQPNKEQLLKLVSTGLSVLD